MSFIFYLLLFDLLNLRAQIYFDPRVLCFHFLRRAFSYSFEIIKGDIRSDPFGVKATLWSSIKILLWLLFKLYHIIRVHVNSVYSSLSLSHKQLISLKRPLLRIVWKFLRALRLRLVFRGVWENRVLWLRNLPRYLQALLIHFSQRKFRNY